MKSVPFAKMINSSGFSTRIIISCRAISKPVTYYANILFVKTFLFRSLKMNSSFLSTQKNNMEYSKMNLDMF